MRNVSSRPHEPSSSKFNYLSDKGPNYAASRNKKPTKGLPIPIPQNPTCDYSSAVPRITSRMQRKDGSTQSNTDNSISRRTRGTAVPKDNNVNHIPTRKSNRVSAREEGNVVVIIDEDDETNSPSPPRVPSTRLSPPRVPSTRLSPPRVPSTRLPPPQVPSTRLSPPPVVRKRRIIQRDDSSSSSGNESSSDNEKARMAKKLRNERNQRRQGENDRKEEISAEKLPTPSRKSDYTYSQPTISSIGKRKDFTALTSMIDSVKKIATVANIVTGRKLSPVASSSSSASQISNRSPTPPPPTRKTPPSPMNHINHKKSTTASTPYIENPKDDKRSYIDRQKDMMMARLQKQLGSNEPEKLPVQRRSSRTLNLPPKQRNPYEESQTSANARPSLGESVLKTSSVFHLPTVLQFDSNSKPLPVNTKESIQSSEDEVSEYEDALNELVESTPEDTPIIPEDPIDNIPIIPIGIDRHILTYPFAGKKSVTLHAKDLDRLEEDQFLNDSLLDIFPKIWADQYPNASAYTFSSFFYTKLAGSGGNSVNYDQIERWTAKINIFEKQLIIIPVAQNNHWYLVVVTNPGLAIKNRKQYGLNLPIDNADENELKDEYGDVEKPVSKTSRPGRKVKSVKAGIKLDSKKPYIMILDALGGSKYQTCENTADYLKKEAMNKLNVKEEDFVEPEFVYTDCPNQKNFVDCGVFCLHYMNSLYKDTERMMGVLYNNLKDDEGWDIEKSLPNFRLTLKRILKTKMLQYRDYLKKGLENNT